MLSGVTFMIVCVVGHMEDGDVLLSPFYIGKCSSQRINRMLRIAQQVSGRGWTRAQASWLVVKVGRAGWRQKDQSSEW